MNSPQRLILDLNAQFLKALTLMEETDENLFITGKAGTGKSTLLEHFRSNTEKKVAVLAPTGVAAINVKGQTIHSFFKFKPGVTLQSIKPPKGDKKKGIYKKLDALIIDEISMVRADLLDCIDRFLRFNGKDPTKPFGGIQMIFVGDLYQLPPVLIGEEKEIFKAQYETPYFFSALIFKQFEMELIELEKIYRQKDEAHIHLLNAIRNNSITDDGLKQINERFDPNFEPPENDFYITLTPTNAQAALVNEERLQRLQSKVYEFAAEISGEFTKEYYPTAPELRVKIGAQVMMLNNDQNQRWVNGTIGKIVDIYRGEEDTEVLVVKMDQGKTHSVSPHAWEIHKFSLENDQLTSAVAGTFTQYPLMLAWAVTIHKSQGKTFEKVVFDIGRGTFAHGQAYVALSRCVSLEGLVLKKMLLKKHIWMDYTVVKFLTQFQYQKSEELCSLEDKVALIRKAIDTKKELHVLYLKANDEKTERTIQPLKVGMMQYAGKSFLGMEAFCLKRQEERAFRVDRILEIKSA